MANRLGESLRREYFCRCECGSGLQAGGLDPPLRVVALQAVGGGSGAGCVGKQAETGRTGAGHPGDQAALTLFQRGQDAGDFGAYEHGGRCEVIAQALQKGGEGADIGQFWQGGER